MTHLLDADLLQRLQGTKLLGRRADARHGVGERRSRAVGPGVEFADYRDYQPGDDFRYLDRHVYARHGRAVVRQFTVEQRFQVTVLLDASASMASGAPSKYGQARRLAAALAAVALYGGDQVDLAVCTGAGVQWHPRATHPRGVPRLLSWLAEREAHGQVDLDAVARVTSERLSRSGLLLVVSDWLLDGVDTALRRWHALQQDVVAVQVLAPDEIDPGRLATGPLQLVDAETGEPLDVELDGDAVARYRAAFQAWQGEFHAQLNAIEGRWVRVTSDEPLRDAVLRGWRRQGLIT
jgi:uncharacterized protein (DUF58 family)